MCNDLLIVDDSATIRSMVKRIIQMTGLDVGKIYEAANGIEALAQLADHQVTAVIVDINMPCMNGIQLLTRMKENDELKHIPVLVASTEGSKQRIEEIMRIGACGFVRKPFRPEQLRDALEPLLGVKDHAAADDRDTDAGVF